MAGAREIQGRMKSIRDTMKITNAMYMISSSKLKRAKKALEQTEPYFYMLQYTLERIMRNFPDVEHPYFDAHPIDDPAKKRTGYIVITGDKGLAGAYNHNVIKMAQREMDAGGGNDMLFIVGQLGYHYFAKKGIPIDTHFHYTAQNPTLGRARVISERMLELYYQRQLDVIFIFYTKITDAAHMEATMSRLLPVGRELYNVPLPADTPMEALELLPSPEVVVERIIPHYIGGFVFGALVESFTSEQNSRMMAMEAATTSAKEMLKALQIQYNRVRQAAITQEITEVISGAKALRRKKGGALRR